MPGHQAAVSVDTHPAAPEGVIYQLVSDVVALAPLVHQVLLTTASCEDRVISLLTGFSVENNGSHALTLDTVKLIPTLGALCTGGGPVQDPVYQLVSDVVALAPLVHQVFRMAKNALKGLRGL